MEQGTPRLAAGTPCPAAGGTPRPQTGRSIYRDLSSISFLVLVISSLPFLVALLVISSLTFLVAKFVIIGSCLLVYNYS
jgi:hypothetical protein